MATALPKYTDVPTRLTLSLCVDETKKNFWHANVKARPGRTFGLDEFELQGPPPFLTHISDT